MSRIKRARPSPALVISIVAMFAALGGGAFAATATTSKQALNNKGNLNKNVVKKKNIAKNAVVTNKIANGKVTGSKLSDESISGEKVGSITTVTETGTATPTGSTTTATCTDGKSIGGGFEGPPHTPVGAVFVHTSKKTDTGWTVSAVAAAAPPVTTYTAYAYCLDN